MKTKADKKVNKIIKQLNRQLKEDIFGDRFWVKQVAKVRFQVISYYLYELKDRLQPERDKILDWKHEWSLFTFHEIHIAMNDFIISSDFWDKYKKGE